MTSNDHLRAAWQALLDGDTDERDRQCELAKEALQREKIDGVKKLMEIDFFVTSRGVVIPTVQMMPKA